MDIYSAIIYSAIIFGTIQSILFLLVYEVLLNQKGFIKQNKLKTLLYCFIFVFTYYCLSLYVPKVYQTPFLTIVSILSFSLISKRPIISISVAFFFYLIILAITDFSVATIQMLIFNITTNEILNNSRYLLIHNVISESLLFFIIVILYKLNLNLTKFNIKKENSLMLNLIIETGLFSIFIFIANLGVLNIKNMMLYNVLVFSIYFIFLIVQIMDLKERERLLNIYNSYKVQEKQIKNMEEIINIIRQEKHDFANHINIIQGLCFLNKPNTVERIKDYVAKISDSIHSSFRYLNTGNDYIDGLLSIKYNYATKNNIDFQVIIDEPLDSLKIKADELISIVSNLVDNAFESYKIKSNSSNKRILFNTFLDKNMFCIKIIDNGDPIPYDIQSKIFERGFSTKEKLNNDHGFGLFITKELVEHNNGEIIFYSSEEETSFLVKFPLREH